METPASTASGAPTARPRPLEFLELLFTAAFLPIAAFSWVGILLAELGVFTGWWLLAGGFFISALAWAGAAREYHPAGLRVPLVPRWSWLWPAVILILAAGLFSRPGEYLIEGADASVYVAIGRNIARTGGIVSADPLADLVPTDVRPSFFPADPHRPQLVDRLPGGLRIRADGRIAPDFFHLLPVWIAIATVAAGPHGAYFVNVLFALLAVAVCWLIGRRVWSPAAGGVAAALLAVNFGQIWHARLASSEMLSQFLLLSGIFFTVLAWDQRARVAGACAGAAVGLAAFTRIDSLLVMVPLAAGWLVLARRCHRANPAWPWYAAVLGVTAAHAVLHAATVSGLYTQRLLGDGRAVLAGVRGGVGPTAAMAMAVAALAMALAAVRFRRRWITWIGLALALALVIRSPLVVVTVSRLLSPVGLVAALAGLALLLIRPLESRVLPVVLPCVAEAALFLAWNETTTLPSDFRRVVPAILPGAMLLVGFLVSHVGSRLGYASRAIWLLPPVLGAIYLADAAPVLLTPPMRGVHAEVADIAHRIPPGALVITDLSLPGHLALALQYSFDRPALQLAKSAAGYPYVAPLIERAIARRRPVFVAVAADAAQRRGILSRRDLVGFEMRRADTIPLRFTRLMPVEGAFPRECRTETVPVALYRIEPRNPDTATALPLTIDIGGDDFGYLVQGFQSSESFPSGRARWTDGDGRLALPRLALPEAGSVALVVRLSATRPPGLLPAVVRLAIDGIPVGVITDTNADFHEYSVPLPSAVRARLASASTVLALASGVFVPKAAGLGNDERQLGILLDWVRLEPGR